MKTLIYHIRKSLPGILLCLISICYSKSLLLAAEIDTLFQSEEIIRMELRSDFSAILKNRTENPKYFDGELIYYTAANESKKLSVRIMVRGKFRLKPDNCNFPPLFVDFKKNEVKNTIFDNQNKLKLVTPCQYEEDVIEEYTVYKLYNKVTDLSIRARLTKILYFDTGSNKKLFEKHSFFIEDDDHAAARNDCHVKDKFMTPFDLDRESYKKLTLFEYIIGNKDWFVTSRQNIIIFQPNDTTKAPHAVPYDFDFSGFVNAEYTKPQGVPDDKLRDKREYKGLCYTDEEFKEVFEFYQKLRPEFESIINNQKLISRSGRVYLQSYIKYFYNVIKSKNLIKQEFLDKCETKKTYNIKD